MIGCLVRLVMGVLLGLFALAVAGGLLRLFSSGRLRGRPQDGRDNLEGGRRKARGRVRGFGFRDEEVLDVQAREVKEEEAEKRSEDQ